jgi:hypothetical protein
MAVDIIRFVWDWDNVSLMEALLAQWILFGRAPERWTCRSSRS